MPPVDAKLIFTILGPIFLLAGAARCVHAGAFVPTGKTWLLVGVVFTLVACWLRQ